MKIAYRKFALAYETILSQRDDPRRNPTVGGQLFLCNENFQVVVAERACHLVWNRRG